MISTGKHDTKTHTGVSDIESAVVYNEEKKQVTIFAVNRNTEENVEFEADVRGFEGYGVKRYLTLGGQKDMYTTNSADKENVTETDVTDYRFDGGILTAVMKPASWNVIVLTQQ